MELFRHNTHDSADAAQAGFPVTEENFERIVPEIRPVVWIANGPHKNYTPEAVSTTYDLGGIPVSLELSAKEPSLIYPDLPVYWGSGSSTRDFMSIRKTPYTQLTPYERANYWRFLEAPYSFLMLIQYACIYLQGLERHLLIGDYETAHQSVLQLRNLYGDKQLQESTANSIMFTSVIHQKREEALRYLQQIPVDIRTQYSSDLALLCMYCLDIPLTPTILMALFKTHSYSSFGCNLPRTLHFRPMIFRDHLMETFKKEFGTLELILKDVLSQEELTSLERIPVRVFSSSAINGEAIPLPKISSSSLGRRLTGLMLENEEISRKDCTDFLEAHRQLRTF